MAKAALASVDIDRSPIALGEEPLSIGRHPKNDIPIEDDLASRFHCVIEPASDGTYILRDLGSRNGTRVNAEKVSATILSDQDLITVGRHSFRFLSEADDAKPVPPKRRWGSSKHDKRKDHAEALPDWAATIRQTVEALPPDAAGLKDDIALLDADGKPAGTLALRSSGPVAIRMLLVAAARSRATDIHCEPKPDHLDIRLRVDGELVHIAEIPAEVGNLAIGLVRTACHLKVVARNAVQDGSFTAVFPDRRIDYRVSLTPSVHGQKLVIRVLDPRVAPQDLDALGMPGYMHQRLARVCRQDAGLLLVAGPTGSGKTTTLYNALRQVDREKRNVVTIEDPVEYHIDHVTQIPVTEQTSFGAMLRSVLRQDPDVILVGEIRDEETARVAMQAAMTGHVVFSTVHSRDTIGAVFRLLDLGLERYLVANALDIVLAQRLVRILCENCKRPVKVSPGQASRIGRIIEGKSHVYAAVGCPKCLRTGFHGRRALFEMLEFTDELRDIVLNNPTINALRTSIETGLFTSLRQSGWLLAAQGVTPLEEVDRVTASG
ncbi:MAG: FHA domain-containing protein, partial [Phycisphaeraceae bacterium]